MHPVTSTDGFLIKNEELIHERLAEYIQNLLSKVHTTDPGFLDDLPTLPIFPKLDDKPSFDEVEKAILSLKGNKTAGHYNIPTEVINYGGCALHRRLHNFIHDCLSAKCLPQQWKNANIIPVHKQKGARAECGNDRGISLLSVAGKVQAKIMLTRLLKHVVDLVLPESQCGLQANTKTSSAMISALQYADDAAIPSFTDDGLQRSLDVMSETYIGVGLVINTTKTEILSTSSPNAPTFSIIIIS